MKKMLLLVWIGCAFCGCASHMANIHPEWNPPNGQEEADKKCQAQAKYAWDKFGAYASCMAAYGYERRSGPKTK